ncbi:MAG: hypothetical protein QGG24_03610 [Vicinamibacterales bacterium]|jgi:hypothetical protein|nr:hypothetical protein [Acidobacteriota bacterium]MDP7294387.1 hypothetical protein [Vicinamibacterales bacterium]MDP7670773.1 hypothetical protein [Vicinamibacterales bacterium]HJO37780.1 hypothetical protein [Vicinamibacterales bacterium]|tara:strand:- start:138 stop:485 length:348 start_codon:yes stop_codon:yes gene_type:complete
MAENPGPAPAAGARQTLIDVDPQRLLIWVVATCVGLEVAFVLLDYHVNYGRLVDIGAIRRFSNIAREDGVASWFGTAQTMCVALTAWAIYVVVGAQQLQQWRRVGWLCWRSGSRT